MQNSDTVCHIGAYFYEYAYSDLCITCIHWV